MLHKIQITKAECDPKKRSSVTISEIIEGGNILVSLSEGFRKCYS